MPVFVILKMTVLMTMHRYIGVDLGKCVVTTISHLEKAIYGIPLIQPLHHK